MSRIFRIARVVAVLAMVGVTSEACPFCDVVGRPLAARRDAASIVAVGEADGAASAADGVIHQPFVVRSVIRGRNVEVDQVVSGRVPGHVDGTAMLFGARNGDEGLRFEAVAADETLLGYIVAAPAVEAPAAERLRWIARFLEHPERAIAEDAFMEFGLAPYSDVVAAADALDVAKLCGWLNEPGVRATWPKRMPAWRPSNGRSGRLPMIFAQATTDFWVACPLAAAKDHAASLATRDPALWDAAVKAVGLPARKPD